MTCDFVVGEGGLTNRFRAICPAVERDMVTSGTRPAWRACRRGAIPRARPSGYETDGPALLLYAVVSLWRQITAGQAADPWLVRVGSYALVCSGGLELG